MADLLLKLTYLAQFIDFVTRFVAELQKIHSQQDLLSGTSASESTGIKLADPITTLLSSVSPKDLKSPALRDVLVLVASSPNAGTALRRMRESLVSSEIQLEESLERLMSDPSTVALLNTSPATSARA